MLEFLTFLGLALGRFRKCVPEFDFGRPFSNLCFFSLLGAIKHVIITTTIFTKYPDNVETIYCRNSTDVIFFGYFSLVVIKLNKICTRNFIYLISQVVLIIHLLPTSRRVKLISFT